MWPLTLIHVTFDLDTSTNIVHVALGVLHLQRLFKPDRRKDGQSGNTTFPFLNFVKEGDKEKPWRFYTRGILTYPVLGDQLHNQGDLGLRPD